jgi:hypothetical protein
LGAAALRVRTDGDAVGRARRVVDALEAAWGRVDRMGELLAQVPQPEESKRSTGHGR